MKITLDRIAALSNNIAPGVLHVERVTVKILGCELDIYERDGRVMVQAVDGMIDMQPHAGNQVSIGGRRR